MTALNKLKARLADQPEELDQAEHIRKNHPKVESGSRLPPPTVEQEDAIDRIVNGRGNVLLTGPAGSGKSTIVKHVRERVDMCMTATTAAAALLIGGTTVDRAFCFSRSTWKVFNDGYLATVMQDLPDLIAIDEASACGSQMCGLIEKAAKDFKKRILLIGDWAQSSPVKDEWGVLSSLIRSCDRIKLTECHRQADKDYLDALNKVRVGEVDDSVERVFSRCFTETPPTDDAFVRLYATNAATDAYNSNRLYALNNGSRVFKLFSKLYDERPPYKQQKSPWDDAYREKLLQDSRLAHDSEFRIGARVVLTMNDGEDMYVNGDAGTIIDADMYDGTKLSDLGPQDFFKPGVDESKIWRVIVQLDRLGQTLAISRQSMEMHDALGELLYTVKGFPLRLGWAMTIHKAQGMTVEKAYLDMSSIRHMVGDSRHGLAYVALSRTRSLDGLRIGGWDPRTVYCSDVVKPFI